MSEKITKDEYPFLFEAMERKIKEKNRRNVLVAPATKDGGK